MEVLPLLEFYVYVIEIIIEIGIQYHKTESFVLTLLYPAL